MTGTFEDITLTWKGAEYKIPSHRVMGALARVEDVVTLAELTDQNRRAPMAKIAQAYASVLRYAGARHVKDEEVYAAIFPSPDDAAEVQQAVHALLLMMIPPDARKKLNGGEPAAIEGEAGEEPRPTDPAAS